MGQFRIIRSEPLPEPPPIRVTMGEVARDQIPSDLPPIPPPTPRRLVTGNVTLDEASERMPYEQRRVMQQFRDQGRLTVEPFPEASTDMGAYDPVQRSIAINTAALENKDEAQTAKTLTHEATHRLQPQPTVGNRYPTRDPIATGYMPTGDPYLDNPREIEARMEEERVTAPPARKEKGPPPPPSVQKLLKDAVEGNAYVLSDESVWVKDRTGMIRRIR